MSDQECTLTEYFNRLIDKRIAELGLTKPTVTARTLRLKTQQSTAELAHRAGVSASYISNLELGQIKNIGSKNRAGLARIAEALGVSPDEYVQACINGGQRNG